jgi:hypothetical protein
MGDTGILNLVEPVTFPIIIAFLENDKQNKDQEREDVREAASGANSRDSLRNTNTEKIEVGHTR